MSPQFAQPVNHRGGGHRVTSTPSPATGPPVAAERWRTRVRSIEAAAIAGVICAVAWSIGLWGLLAAPSVDASDAEIIRYYSDPRPGLYTLALLQFIVIGTIAFLWFIGVVRSRLGQGEPKLFGTVFQGGAILMAGVVLAGTAALAAPAVLVEVGGRLPDPGAASLTRALAVTLLSVFAPRVATLVVFATAALGRATGAPQVARVAELCSRSLRVRECHRRAHDCLRVPGLDSPRERRPARSPIHAQSSAQAGLTGTPVKARDPAWQSKRSRPSAPVPTMRPRVHHPRRCCPCRSPP